MTQITPIRLGAQVRSDRRRVFSAVPAVWDGAVMSRQQFGSLAGFLIVAVWALGGPGVLLSALLAAAAGWLAAGALRRERPALPTRPPHRTAPQETP